MWQLLWEDQHTNYSARDQFLDAVSIWPDESYLDATQLLRQHAPPSTRRTTWMHDHRPQVLHQPTTTNTPPACRSRRHNVVRERWLRAKPGKPSRGASHRSAILGVGTTTMRVDNGNTVRQCPHFLPHCVRTAAPHSKTVRSRISLPTGRRQPAQLLLHHAERLQ